jgi:hypothetical protein
MCSGFFGPIPGRGRKKIVTHQLNGSASRQHNYFFINFPTTEYEKLFSRRLHGHGWRSAKKNRASRTPINAFLKQFVRFLLRRSALAWYLSECGKKFKQNARKKCFKIETYRALQIKLFSRHFFPFYCARKFLL